MSPFFSIVVVPVPVPVPVHAPVRGGRRMLSGVAKELMCDQLRDRSPTISMRESPRDEPHPADGISSYDDHAQEHLHRLAADATALVVRPNQMLEMYAGRFLPCHELERVR